MEEMERLPVGGEPRSLASPPASPYTEGAARKGGLLFVSTDYPPPRGGLQYYTRHVLEKLPPGLLAFALLYAPQPAPGSGIPVPPLPHRFHPRQGRLATALASFHHIPRLKARHRIRAQLHLQWSTALPSLLLSLLGLPSRYAVFVHGQEIVDPGRPFLNGMKRLVLARADRVIAGSRFTRELALLAGARPERTVVLPYPLPGPASRGETRPAKARPGGAARGEDLPARPASGQERSGGAGVTPLLRIVAVHRLVARKGTALLLGALASLRDRSWALDLAGDGPERDSLEALTRERGLAERVFFHGEVPEEEKGRLLRGADLFVLPSLGPQPGLEGRPSNFVEGLGLGLLEAQACGLPVLAARTGGIPEALAEGETGLLFEAGSEEDLAAKLALLLDDAGLRRRLGEAGPASVEARYGERRNVEGLSRLLGELLE